MAKSAHEVVPSARRLIRSLRNMGYDFAAAVADLVDNSIEAGATKVWIDVEFKGDQSLVRIADNGLGMSATELREAMRFGSERDYDYEEDLGKFGLGLKTASLSQCQRLSVATRTKKGGASSYCWDLKHIEKTNKWEIFVPSDKELKIIYGRHAQSHIGTVVVWEDLDQILGYKHPYDEPAKRRLATMCRELENHLSMVFHRFLQREVSGRQLTIFLNENELIPWDPFSRSEPKTKELEPTIFRLEHEGAAGRVTLQPYILPHQNDFSSKEAFFKASGPQNWNQQQGFYIYRANRMIQSGGWSRLRTADEHTKLARVSLSFSPHLDEAFKINVAKMRVQLPSAIREQISEALKPVIRQAQQTYRRKEKPGNITPPTNGTASPLGTSSTSTQPGSPRPKLWMLDELENELKNVSDPKERVVIAKVFQRFRELGSLRGKKK